MYSRPVTRDKGWAWVICLVTFFVHVTVDGVTFSFGVLFVELTEYFGSSRAIAAWIGALLMTLMHILGLLASSLIKFWGFRRLALLGTVLATAGFSLSFVTTELWHLFFTIGILAGTGYGFLYFSSVLALQHWFEKRLALANGLSSAGNGVGTFFIAPLIEYLIQQFGWRGTMLIIAGIVAQNCVFSMLLQRGDEKSLHLTSHGHTDEPVTPDGIIYSITSSEEPTVTEVAKPQQPKSRQNEVLPSVISSVSLKPLTDAPSSVIKGNYSASPNEKKNNCCLLFRDLIDISVLKIVPLDIFLFACMFFNFSFIIPFMFLPDRAVGLGIDRSKAALLISIMAAVNSLFRICVGAIGDIVPQYRRIIFGVIVMIGGLANVFSIFCKTFWALALYSAVNGATVGTIASLAFPILRDCVGLEKVSKATAFLFIAIGTSILTCSPFAGWLYDITGSYDVPFILTGCFVFFGGLIVTLMPFLSNCITSCCFQTSYHL